MLSFAGVRAALEVWVFNIEKKAKSNMKKITLAVAVVAAFAGTAFATDPLIKELFPWFEVGEVVDEATATKLGFALDWQTDAQSELGACAQYVFKDPSVPETQVLTVILSVPESKVLSIRIDAKCETDEEAENLIEDLLATFTPLACSDEVGTKILAFNWTGDESIYCSLSEKSFGFRMLELIEAEETAEE